MNITSTMGVKSDECWVLSRQGSVSLLCKAFMYLDRIESSSTSLCLPRKYYRIEKGRWWKDKRGKRSNRLYVRYSPAISDVTRRKLLFFDLTLQSSKRQDQSPLKMRQEKFLLNSLERKYLRMTTMREMLLLLLRFWNSPRRRLCFRMLHKWKGKLKLAQEWWYVKYFSEMLSTRFQNSSLIPLMGAKSWNWNSIWQKLGTFTGSKSHLKVKKRLEF